MLEFIVLGQVPGTSFVITLPWVITIAMLVLGTSVMKHEYKQRHAATQPAIEELAI